MSRTRIGKGVVATSSVAVIVVGAAHQIVVTVAAGERVVAGIPVQQIVAVLSEEPILTRAPTETIVADATLEGVVSVVAEQPVGAVASVHLILPRTAENHVVSVAAGEDVVPVAAGEEVVATEAIHGVLAAPAEDVIGTARSIEDVVVPSPDNHGGAGGQQAGLSVSTTVTRWVAVATFPAPSVARQVTSVVPGGNCAGALFVTVTPQGSLAVAVPMSNEPQTVVVTSAGTKVNVGGVVSPLQPRTSRSW